MTGTRRLLLFLMLLPFAGQAQVLPWRLKSPSHILPLGNEASFVTKELSGPVNAKMQLVIFDDRHCQIRVVANTDPLMTRSLAEIGQAEKGLAVCNGGYFNPGKLTPVGLEIADGRRSGTFDAWGWVGALGVEKGKPALVWQEEFHDSPDITQFVQCSPWLVSDGRMVPLPQGGEDPRNARTFILTDGEGRWAIGICKRVGLLELARLLITPDIITEMKVRRALNLDGGPSTGLWCREPGGREFHEKPGWAVRNTIVVVARISP